MKPALWYLATPYSKFPAGHQAAYVLACRLTAKLLKLDVPVFSPIAHSHGVAEHGALDKVDHDFWVKADEPLLFACSGLIVVKAEGWDNSRGMAHEIDEFTDWGFPIVYWDPACDVPAELLP